MMAHDPSLSAGVAALNALTGPESEEFEAHLADCPTCSAEIAGFRETAARLGAAAAETPPASMRAAVMALVSVTRQLPPEVSQSTKELPVLGRHHGLGDQLPLELVAPVEISGELPAADADPKVSVSPTPEAKVINLNSRRRFSGRLMLAAAAVIAIAIAAVAIFQSPETTDADLALQNCVLNAADTHVQPATPDSQATANVRLSNSCGAAIIELSNVGTLPADQTYQLWIIAGDQPRSVDTMVPDANGTMPVVVTPLQVGDTQLGVTVEPAGGSEQPTSPILVSVPLSA